MRNILTHPYTEFVTGDIFGNDDVKFRVIARHRYYCSITTIVLELDNELNDLGFYVGYTLVFTPDIANPNTWMIRKYDVGIEKCVVSPLFVIKVNNDGTKKFTYHK